MPRASIWIRNEDWEKWQEIDNKSLLISRAINQAIKVQESAPPTSDEDINLPYYDKPPEKNNSEGKPSNSEKLCPDHLVAYSVCRMMKTKSAAGRTFHEKGKK